MGKFEKNQLVNMIAVGKVTPRSVRLWMRSDVPGKHRIEIKPYNRKEPRVTVTTTIPRNRSTDYTHSVLYPNDFPDGKPLRPSSRYNYRIVRVSDGTPLGEGRFAVETVEPCFAPAPGQVLACYRGRFLLGGGVISIAGD